MGSLIRSTLAVCAVILVGATVAGCHDSHGHRVAVVVEPTEFFYEAKFVADFNKEFFIWENDFDNAFVEFEAIDFDGEITIEVYDDLDQLVYLATYVGSGTYILDLDETDLGFSGDWLVVVSTFDAFGYVNLTLY